MRSRDKIVDATIRVIEAGGFESATIVALAAESGVSRQTIYSIFGSREAVISEAVARLATESLEQFGQSAMQAESAVEFLVETIVGGRSMLRAHPVLATMMLTGESDSSNPLLDDDMMERALPVAVKVLEPVSTRFGVDHSRLPDISEMCVRLAISLIFFDSPRVHTDDGARDFLRGWLAPALAAPNA